MSEPEPHVRGGPAGEGPADRVPLSPGLQLGGYLLVRKLGQGGMAEDWEATDEQIDAILTDYGIPSPVEWARPGSYIQTTTRWQVEANRRKNDIVFIPVECTELHGRHLPSAADTL